MYKAFKESLASKLASLVGRFTQQENESTSSASRELPVDQCRGAIRSEDAQVIGHQLEVDSEIKKKWEMEQLLLKEQLRLEDVPEWAKMRHSKDNADETSSSDITPLEYLGGVDISFVKGDNVNACAALTVVKLPSLELVYEDYKMVELTAPYIPGFLAFREVPFLVEMFQTLQMDAPQFTPQVILCDGNGILHPREFGFACHLGVLLNIPTLGAAKKLFQVQGLEKNEAHREKISNLGEGHDCFELVGDSGRTLGLAFKSNETTKNPIFVSPGHMITLETALWVVKLCCKHRVPEPVRQADIGSRKYLRENFLQEDHRS